LLLRKDDVATKPDEREENTDSILKLKAFREEAKTGRIVDFWEHISELENKVLLSLFKAINSKKGIGWIRADKVDVAAMSDELVRLSKENHDLRNEVKRLESMIKARNPKIDVKINDGNDLKLEIIRRNDYKLYEPVKYEDLPEEVSNYMQPDVINEYNTQLSKIHELNNYNDAISSIKYIKDNQIKPTITVTNTGTGKANDIDITIEFPDEVVVMKDKKLNLDLDKVEKPEGLPKHPYDLAKERRQEEMLKQHPELKAAINISKMANAFRINDSFRSAVNLSSIADSVGKFSIHQSLSVLEKENKIDISINDLLHTNEITFDDEDFIIIPKKSGCYEIKVSIICEEYETRDEFLIPVTIEETVKYFDVENYL